MLRCHFEWQESVFSTALKYSGVVCNLTPFMRNAGKLICSSDLYVLLSILGENVNQSSYLRKASQLVGSCSYSSKWRHVLQNCSEMTMVMVYVKMTSTAIYCANEDYYKEEGSQGAVKSIQHIRIKQSTSQKYPTH